MPTHPFKPVFDSRSKILILGSFPSVKSREMGFYYAHSQNRFWKVLIALFGSEHLRNVQDKIDFLLKHQVAIHDAAYSCSVKGSSDNSISSVKPANLDLIFENADIKAVFANGNTSYAICKKFYDFEVIKLPSTSPANAKFSLEKLVDEWKIILKYLE
ncbi:DNA-deoxyinosine glycosylase [Campylobacter fetus]|uniref:DNA-deoxyinosine glycosylase n=1 Tax=Campylobacter fetus TaxID=196 RepID=A0A5L8JEY3_CAMFE|nr:DNA-deoxyinosine glycosylase [Campylobacter fetus]HDX6329164.1 DNA-deoxyinosine glycosylase [Campylobacter fetus subsp. venerealis]EAI4414245.1 DNA-deoxyinosine glycosylase [Campylobacter fetus]EAI5407810.1 DNA-deoxyinosine glycosylase [Campylobacter fetus]EAI5647546.1 DNA-deoxyinosine glycosylase [Campylobacter fetus]EAI5945910.1 DNA-deoxyinosine glycosylase [Campylobacter fetus]